MTDALIVDDSQAIRAVIREQLALLAPRVTTREAGNLADARECLAAKAPDLVFLDLNVKGVNGAVLIDEIAKTNPNARVIVATGLGREDPIVVDSLSLGGHAFLRKPFRVADTRMVLQDLGVVGDPDTYGM